MLLWKPICDLHSNDAAFNYCAQPGAAFVFTILFAIPFSVHLLQMFTFRKRFCWVIVMGALWELVSFITRVFATKNQTKQSTDGLISTLLVLLAPLWINAFVYMVFGRMVFFFLSEQKVGGIKATNMARWFVWLDITSFLVQVVGGVMASGNNSPNLRLGLRIYTFGVAIQQVFIICFSTLIIRFHRKMLNGHAIPARGTSWKTLAYVIYVTLILITIRIIFRIMEFASLNNTNKAASTESFFYLFDAVPMCIALLLWNIWHPGRFLVGPEASYPKISRKEKKALKREKIARKRLAREGITGIELEDHTQRWDSSEYSGQSNTNPGVWSPLNAGEVV